MARQRRGGFRGPELRGTLGTLLRTALEQTGAVRDALERGAREGRSRLDDALAGRRRDAALAELGEIVLDLVKRGEIDPTDLPETHDVLARLEELDEDGGGDGGGGGRGADEPTLRGFAAPKSRERFDDRRARGGQRDDGTVGSSTWSPPMRAAKPATRVWRPPADDAPSGGSSGGSNEGDPADRPAASAPPPRAAHRKGGISFGNAGSADANSDADLADYMHPDDVPPKPKSPPDGDS